jgi:hypothetical protein
VTTIHPGNLGGLAVTKSADDKLTNLNILVYGESGIGKTIFAGSADAVPELRPVLFVDIEGGTFSLQNMGYKVDVVRVQTWKQMQDLYNELHEGKHPYKTIVLDSLTEIQKFNMYNVMTELIANKPDADPDVPGMREWGKNIEQMRRYVRAFRDLPVNTIFTALQKEEKDDRTGVRWIKPSMSGKLASEVAAFLDVVLYYYQKEMADGDATVMKRFMLTQKTQSQIAKDRSGRLPIVIEDPTMRVLFDLMYPKASKA